MTDGQKRNYAELASKWCVPYRESLIDYASLFGNDNPVTLEIGFGMGSATAEIAKNNPDKNYIGIEVHKPGIGKLLGEIRSRNLENLRIIEGDAAFVLSNMIRGRKNAITKGVSYSGREPISLHRNSKKAAIFTW